MNEFNELNALPWDRKFEIIQGLDPDAEIIRVGDGMIGMYFVATDIEIGDGVDIFPLEILAKNPTEAVEQWIDYAIISKAVTDCLIFNGKRYNYDEVANKWIRLDDVWLKWAAEHRITEAERTRAMAPTKFRTNRRYTGMRVTVDTELRAQAYVNEKWEKASREVEARYRRKRRTRIWGIICTIWDICCFVFIAVLFWSVWFGGGGGEEKKESH